MLCAAAVGWFVLKNLAEGRSRQHFGRLQAALRQLEMGPGGVTPSWMNSKKEKEFFDGVLKLAVRRQVSSSYVILGFMSPDQSATLFALAGYMERSGSSFAEQQAGVSEFIVDSWNDLSSIDKKRF